MHTIEDLIKAGKDQVRVTPDLMTAYIKLFKEQFGREPDCAGCTFQSDWNKLTRNVTVNNIEIMSDKTFKLRDTNKIYSYDYEDKKTGRELRKRRFGYSMEEEFAEEYLTNGTPEQLKVRKTEFKILPEKFRESKESEELANMKAAASEKGYPKEEYKDITEEADMIAYLELKVLEEAEETQIKDAAEERMKKEREDKEAEEARLAKIEAERLAKEETDRIAKEEADRIAKEKSEAEAKAKDDIAAKAKEGKVK